MDTLQQKDEQNVFSLLFRLIRSTSITLVIAMRLFRVLADLLSAQHNASSKRYHLARTEKASAEPFRSVLVFLWTLGFGVSVLETFPVRKPFATRYEYEHSMRHLKSFIHQISRKSTQGLLHNV